MAYGLVGAIVCLFALKYYVSDKLRKRQFVSNSVEQRTLEPRIQSDDITMLALRYNGEA